MDFWSVPTLIFQAVLTARTVLVGHLVWADTSLVPPPPAADLKISFVQQADLDYSPFSQFIAEASVQTINLNLGDLDDQLNIREGYTNNYL